MIKDFKKIKNKDGSTELKLEEEPKRTPHTLRYGGKAHILTREDSRKGGSVTAKESPKKAIATYINGLLANKKLSEEKKNVIKSLHKGDYAGVLNQILALRVALGDDENVNQVSQLIWMLARLVPQQVETKNVNLNINTTMDEKELEKKFNEWSKIKQKGVKNE